jgi:vitamin B12 transporter
MFLSFFKISFAQSALHDSVRNLEPVVVTANKIEQKQQETGKVMTVISSEVLRQNTNQSLTEILNRQVGLVIGGSNSTPGSVQTVYMRGASAANTLILLDGIPLYDASGISSEFDLNTFLPSQIERIEILKGAQSTLYGSDAVAGVINIITRKPEGKRLFAEADLSAASYDTYRTFLRAGSKNKKGFFFDVNYAGFQSSGFSSAYDIPPRQRFDRDGHWQDAVTATLGFQSASRFSLNIFGKYNSSRADIDAGAFTDDRDFTYNIRNSILGLRSILHVSRSSKLSFNYQYNNYHRSYLNDSGYIGGFSSDPFAYYTIFSHDTYQGLTHFGELNYQAVIGKHFKGVAGVEYRKLATAQDYFYLSNYGPYTPLPLGKDTARASQWSGYALLLFANKGLTAGLGGRLNKHSIYGTNHTFSFNPAYTIHERHKIFVNIASAYRIPSLYQLYSEFGNKALKPEQSLSYEFGWQYADSIWSCRITGFRRIIRDVFTFYTDPVTFMGFYVNEDKQDDKGLEAEGSVNLLKGLQLSANYTVVTGRIITQGGSVKDTSYFNLFRRPREVLNARIDYADPKWHVSLSLRSVSSTLEPFYGEAPKRLSGYYTLDLQAGYQCSRSVGFYCDLRNMTDQLYFDQWGYGTMGFNVRTGIRLAF